jgi:hypothetical protein
VIRGDGHLSSSVGGQLVEIVTERSLRLVHAGNGDWSALSGLRR